MNMNAEDIVAVLYNPVSLAVIAAFLAASYIWRQQHHFCNYPAGPFSFPLLGNLPQVVYSGSLNKFLNGCQKQYGDIFTMKLGGHRRVVISGYANIHQLLVKNTDVTSNRHTGSLSRAREKANTEQPGLIFAPFPHWKTLRSFSLKVMREEGMGKASLEPKIHHEINMFCKHFIEPKLGRPYDLSNDVAKVTSNIISEMIFGGRSDYDDPEFIALITSIISAIQTGLIRGIMKNLPLPQFLMRQAKLEDQEIGIARRFVEKKISEHRENLNTEDPKDIFDEFLIHQMSLNETNNQQNCYTDGNLVTMTMQLYGAGTETTSTALKWAFLFTAYHPDVMKKVQEEIMNEIGADKEVTTADKSHMPYIDAVLLETLRVANITPVALPHLLEKDLVIDGKIIPAGSDLMMNVGSVLHDEKVFEDPQKFNPDRYMAGDTALMKSRIIPFSLGRRVCLGESLARMELFLIYVTILQRYNIKLAEDNSFKIQHSSKPSIINAPRPYRLVFSHK